ncbi:2-phospho-L-lactate guanylyltransferase [Blastococcus sp. PRF04-17]|uniref:2-phospho-L-lactate guanylyltransferase n=1 Tax=Blastococcus sp. PRF04-17 TaxID=2933797 RepID=UPI001FF6BA66|nr:2-phospho-L-lactate guanylyltransferase [Blastococcus sp. PRF04-17]UOY03183.1 2-phospho-L-lactate guanylyltransferase [Blastococcus sp. PRF04-17]
MKRLSSAKSRLTGLTPSLRAQLVFAMAVDTVEAAAEASRVRDITVLTDEPSLQRIAPTLGVHVLPDEGQGDLNRALVRGAEQLDDRAGMGTAVLLADLPGLRADDLDQALAFADGHPRAFVADHRGTGTTLLTSARGDALRPCFGVDSASAHAASGAVAVPLSVATLRHDVDVSQDLGFLRELNVGRHTRALLAPTLASLVHGSGGIESRQAG